MIIVGAGSAGGIVANRLAAAGLEVTLIEAGPDTHRNRQLDWLPGVSDAKSRWRGDYVRAKRLGGGSTINGMVADVPPLDHPMWGGLDVAPSLGRILEQIRPETATPGPLGRRLLELVDADGAWPWSGRAVELMTRNGARLDIVDAVLDPWPDDVDLAAGRTVESVTSTAGRVNGVRLDDGSEIHGERVILCAGARATPLLVRQAMLDAGLVPPTAVGGGLMDHPAIPLTVELSPGLRLESDSDVAPATVALARDGGGGHVLILDHLGSDEQSRRFGLALVALLEPATEGTIDRPALLVDPSDLDRLRNLLRSTIDLLTPLVDERSIFGVFIDDRGTSARALMGADDATLDRWIRQRAVTEGAGAHYHAAASCRLGDAIDDTGAVLGLEGLHVMDASAFATIPPVNPHLAVLVLADALVSRMLGSLRA